MPGHLRTFGILQAGGSSSEQERKYAAGRDCGSWNDRLDLSKIRRLPGKIIVSAMAKETPILQKAWKYCAYQDRYSQQVYKKLLEWGASLSEARDIMANLVAEKFLDDERYVRSFVRGHFYHKQWGRTRIRYALANQQIDKSLIERQIEDNIVEEEYRATAQALAAQKLRSLSPPKTPDEQRSHRQKVARFLLQRGFEWSVVAPIVFAGETVAEMQAEESWEEE